MIIWDLLGKGRTDPPPEIGADQKKLKTFFVPKTSVAHRIDNALRIPKLTSVVLRPLLQEIEAENEPNLT